MPPFASLLIPYGIEKTHAIATMRTTNQDKTVRPIKNTMASRKWYSLKIKAAAVEKVRSSGKPAAWVAAEYGVPAQTLSNWIRADRSGSLGELVRLNVSEMEFIVKYCSATTDGELPVPSTSAEQKALAKLKKKITSALNRARRITKL